MRKLNQVGILMFGGLVAAGLLAMIGAVLPWATLGILSVAGTSGDGTITLVLGVVLAGIAGVGFVARPARYWMMVVCLGAGAISGLILAVAVYDMNNVASLTNRPTILGSPSIGSGLYLTAVAGALGVVVTLVGLFVADARPVAGGGVQRGGASGSVSVSDEQA